MKPPSSVDHLITCDNTTSTYESHASMSVLVKNNFPLFKKALFHRISFLDQFCKHALLGSPFCWRGFLFGSHFTENWVPIGSPFGKKWVPMACGHSEMGVVQLGVVQLGVVHIGVDPKCQDESWGGQEQERRELDEEKTWTVLLTLWSFYWASWNILARTCWVSD